jgi:hypothetical protein
MKHQRHLGMANGISLREVGRIDALISDLDRRAQLLDRDVTAEEQHALVFSSLEAGSLLERRRRAEAI